MQDNQEDWDVCIIFVRTLLRLQREFVIHADEIKRIHQEIKTWKRLNKKFGIPRSLDEEIREYS